MKSIFQRLRHVGVLTVAAVGVSACSSIVDGTTQQLFITTTPTGGNCDITRQGTTIGKVNPTPGNVVVEKTKHDITINCVKEGYHTSTYFNKSGVAAATFGNIILGGGIGWAIDSASGADNKYTSPINIDLVLSTDPAPSAVFSPDERDLDDDQ